jgi:hypothetical protein
MNRRKRLISWLDQILNGKETLAISPNLRTDSGWSSLVNRSHDRDAGDLLKQYEDALTAYRKNPIAWRIIQTTTDYTIANGIHLSSPDPNMDRFIQAFWHHPENHIPTRLESMCDELSRSGDLFPVLFRQRQNGVSLLRFLTKDQIHEIKTAPNDWEREVTIVQKTSDPTKPKNWRTPHYSRSYRSRAVALHYSINRPIGAIFGESDLATLLPWLLRYSRMLEDRVRFHWATRLFLWFVQVPRNRVAEKAEQYRTPPEAGSVIVHDESEQWDAKSPVLRGADAAPDLKAVRNMIDAGSGYPPHWRGEATDVNLATAQAMQEPAERHLLRRQTYFTYMLSDITYQAYVRANQLRPEMWPMPEEINYKELFNIAAPDVSRSDNNALAQAAERLANAFQSIRDQYPQSDTLRRILLKLVLNFAGEVASDETLDQIMTEAINPPDPNTSAPAAQPTANGAARQQPVPKN